MLLMKEHVGKLISDVEELIYREKKPVESYRYKKAGAEKLAIDREDIPSWHTLKNEDIWGGNREYWLSDDTYAKPFLLFLHNQLSRSLPLQRQQPCLCFLVKRSFFRIYLVIIYIIFSELQ